MDRLTEKQARLLNYLKYLPIPEDAEDTEFMKQQRDNMIVCIMLDAIQCDYVEKAIEIIDENYDKTVFDIMRILIEKGLGSSVEIVDDDELDEDD